MRPWIRAGAVAGLAAIALTACAADDDQPAATGSGVADGGAGVSSAGGTSGDADRGVEEAGAGGGGAATGAEILNVAAPSGRQVVFTARLGLEVADTAQVAEDIRRAVEAAGGFVASADLRRTGQGDRLAGNLTLRVPAGDLGTTLRSLKNLADRVVEESVDSDDVTGEVADVAAQLRNLRAFEVELVGLLSEIRERTDSADQVLTVFERIREVRAEIERLEGRREVLDDLVALATVHVELTPTPATAPIASDEWRPGAVVRDALRATVSALQAIADVGIRLALTVLPLLLLTVGLPLAVAASLRRAWRRRQAPSPPVP